MGRECVEYSRDKVFSILEKIDTLNHLNDVDTILDRILYEARNIANADAGSIFLVEGSDLTFSYVHNDTLFKEDETNVALYDSTKVPISVNSIVGCAAKTGKTLAIDDAYDIPEDRPYSFNPFYDRESGYKTKSILAIPLMTFQNKLVGVMQLINAKDEFKKTVPFSEDSRNYVPLFANHASVVIERGLTHRELILRMVKMAELKDPAETGAHVQRVGAYSAEIYQRWALNRKTDRREVKRTKDLIRLASMLHDVGKVGITDLILKKPGKLTDKEYDTMKWHTVFGARLFVNNTSKLDQMSCEIALNHHEKWGGGGYPGKVSNVQSEKIRMGKPKKGEEIPFAARITTLADVYDALSSKRSYKEPWPDDKIFDAIEKDTGTHFDPSVVEAFFQIYKVVTAIRDKFSE